EPPRHRIRFPGEDAHHLLCASEARLEADPHVRAEREPQGVAHHVDRVIQVLDDARHHHDPDQHLEEAQERRPRAATLDEIDRPHSRHGHVDDPREHDAQRGQEDGERHGGSPSTRGHGNGSSPSSSGSVPARWPSSTRPSRYSFQSTIRPSSTRPMIASLTAVRTPVARSVVANCHSTAKSAPSTNVRWTYTRVCFWARANPASSRIHVSRSTLRRG